jgi:glycosyltransferase involved in cell wall biosynthesis
MKKPLFSCVIPVKGPRPFFDEALQSLYAQDMGDDLEIIVQDADEKGLAVSSQRLAVSEGGLDGIRWFREADKGQSDALNKGFAKANGEWLFWLNADDVLLPGALRKVRDFINRVETCSSCKRGMFGDRVERVNCVEWIAGDEFFIDEKSRKLSCSVGNGWHDWLYRHAVPHVNGPSAFFKKELFERAGGFDVDLKYCMDWDIWIRFMKAGARFERLGKFLWAQRRWSGSKTQRELSEAELVEQQAEIARMLRKNAFDVTARGIFILRLWRLLSGCYFKEKLCGR